MAANIRNQHSRQSWGYQFPAVRASQMIPPLSRSDNYSIKKHDLWCRIHRILECSSSAELINKFLNPELFSYRDVSFGSIGNGHSICWMCCKDSRDGLRGIQLKNWNVTEILILISVTSPIAGENSPPLECFNVCWQRTSSNDHLRDLDRNSTV